MDIQNICTQELIELKNKISEELKRREINRTAVVWSIAEEKKEEKPQISSGRAEFYIG